MAGLQILALHIGVRVPAPEYTRLRLLLALFLYAPELKFSQTTKE